jgi:subtilisin family serine protease
MNPTPALHLVSRPEAHLPLRIPLLLALVVGCGGGDNVGPSHRASKLAMVVQPAGQAQSGLPISPQPAVQLQDAQGVAVGQAGVQVSVSIASGGGSLVGPTTANTSSSGQATFTGLGIHGSVGPRSLTFTAPDLSAVTSATIDLSAGAAALLVAGDGNGQTAGFGSRVAIPPSVTITDGDNNPVAGIAVGFQVTAGGGAVEPTTVSSNSDGVAAVTSWTLGAAPGPNSLTATAAAVAGSSVIFTATATSDVATITGTITTSNALLARSKAGAGTARLRNPAILQFVPFQAHDFRFRSSRQPARYTPDELIVRYRPSAIGAPAMGSSALASRSLGAAISGAIRSHITAHMAASASALKGVSPAIMAARIRVRNPADLAAVAAKLRTDPAVATVERNGLMSREATNMRLPTRSSNDPLYALQAWSYGIIDLPEAWATTTGSASVLVAVVDDGIRFDHPDIAGNLTHDGYDFVSNDFAACSGSIGRSGDGDGYDPDPTIPAVCPGEGGPTMLGGHGLHVAGTIGAVGNDGLGVSGINWIVHIRPVRVLDIEGSGTDYDVAQGILYAAGLDADNGAGGTVKATTGAKVINLSFGGPDPSNLVHDAIIKATTAGALVVAGAGNEATAAPFYPAAFPEVLSVSAVGPDRELASYSSFGNTIDIAAPGGDFADGEDGSDPSFAVLSLIWAFSTGTPDYAFADGTSMATPHVAGVAALLLAQNPSLSVSQLRSRLIDYAVDAGSSGRDDRYGAGIVNARNSLTQSLGPTRQVRARLYDASTGSVVQIVAVTGSGSYTFLGVTSGSYRLFAGQDEDGDQAIGLPGRRWGAFGGSATPSSITVTGAGTHHASFAIGRPVEQEPNETFGVANVLPVGGYLFGTTSATDTDVYRVLIPQQDRYVFETSAVDGACGFALEGDTSIGLYDAQGVLLAANDDIDQKVLNLCSRVNFILAPGEYQVRVQAQFGGSYRIQARVGP